MALGATLGRTSARLVPWLAAGAAVCSISVGGFQLWQAAAISHQAVVAQERAAAAWRSEAALPDQEPAIARLSSAARDLDLYVLPEADWDSLKDGPGLFAGVLPGQPGLSVIAGHRETHFAVLRELSIGDAITVEDRDGNITDYLVTAAEAVDGRTVAIGAVSEADMPATLMLVTCYPFESTEIGPERYVVTAVASM